MNQFVFELKIYRRPWVHVSQGLALSLILGAFIQSNFDESIERGDSLANVSVVLQSFLAISSELRAQLPALEGGTFADNFFFANIMITSLCFVDYFNEDEDDKWYKPKKVHIVWTHFGFLLLFSFVLIFKYIMHWYNTRGTLEKLWKEQKVLNNEGGYFRERKGKKEKLDRFWIKANPGDKFYYLYHK